ncbi:MAG TPA: GGDEF domain-containing protein [Candidatus Saccharimonadales bacterium]|nr:GGDEF domain-containing protein [Candidatus Saccharimonadales bacterium]
MSLGDTPALERVTLQALDELARGGILPTDTRGLAPGQLRYYFPDGTAVVVIAETGAEPTPPRRIPVGARWAEDPPADSLRALLHLHEELLTRDNSALRSPNELIRTLLDRLPGILGSDGVNWARAAEWGATSDWDPALISPPYDPRELEQVFRAGHIVVWNDLPGGGQPGSLQMRALAAARVGLPEEAWSGVLEAWSRTPGCFTDARLSLLEAAAAEMGVLLRQLLQLQRFVFLDALTGLYNRSYYELQMRRELARAQRDREPLALLLCDVDNFKRFNTLYGYAGGDQVLRGVADILQGTVRPFDSVARYGGEEFVVILSPPVGPEDARTIAERLRHAVDQARFEVVGLDRGRRLVGVTVSVGVALFPQDAQGEADLWRKANESVLRAKASGKNQVHFWSAS